jgi:U3 small nucleolar RNA-associated protein 13
VHHDQNIVVASLSELAVTRQIIGFNDEVIDTIFLSATGPDSHLVLATNSNLIRIYDSQTMDARLLGGHTDVVLCLDKSPDGKWLVSGSKDNTARIWTHDDVRGWRCIAVAQGHAEAIGAVAMSRTSSKFLFTASQDRTVKMWDLSELDSSASEPVQLKSLATMRIHEKDINALDVSPNDGLLVSGSQDKTLKLFSIDYRAPSAKQAASGSIKQLGVCKGHKRGVWSVKFSTTDKVVASGAADRTIRLWSLDDFTCVKVCITEVALDLC